MTDKLRIADLPTSSPTEINWVANRGQMDEIAAALGLLSLRKMRLEGELRPSGDTDWVLSARLGATVAQPCVVTLEPVTTRIEEEVSRTFVKDWNQPEESEFELEAGEDSDPLPEMLGIRDIAQEALALALPANPRHPDADTTATNFGPDGVDPLTDETSRPFAGLADLKEKLENKE